MVIGRMKGGGEDLTGTFTPLLIKVQSPKNGLPVSSARTTGTRTVTQAVTMIRIPRLHTTAPDTGIVLFFIASHPFLINIMEKSSVCKASAIGS
jgi:hypothetical protein